MAVDWMRILILLTAATADAGDVRCGKTVHFNLLGSSHFHCLFHNSSSSTLATAIIRWNTQVVRVLRLLPGQHVEVAVQPNSVLTLRSTLSLCYSLTHGKCIETVIGPERRIRAADFSQENPSHNHEQLFEWSVLAVLLLLPLATASFLCCHAAGNRDSQPMKSRKLSTKDREGLSASTDISINITDSDHPLGSDLSTTFYKSEKARDEAIEASASAISRASSSQSLSQDLAVINSAQLESSLDIGIRDSSYGVKHGISLSSVASLGPRVPPEGSSLDNLLTIDKHLSVASHSPVQSANLPPPPTVLPSPSLHTRQHSTPVSLPPPLSPQQKPRPLTIIGQPSDQHCQRSPGPPLLPPKPDACSSPPPLTPVSVVESGALEPVKPGCVEPCKEVQQPLPSFFSLSDAPHASEGPQCNQCGARLAATDCCQQCQCNNPNTYELEAPENYTLSSPPLPQNTGSPEPDPLYERIGSIRRSHFISRSKPVISKPRLPSPVHLPLNSKATCPLPIEEIHHLPRCALPSEGAPLPPRPPTLGIMRGESPTEHNYESLPSTFVVDSPDTVYAHISSPEPGEAESPPYCGQRAQMLKIDSQGYAEVVNNEEEEEEPRTPDPGYSPILPLSPASQAVASDYEVPVRVSLPPLSPSLLHPSPTHSQFSPIPVPSPVVPLLDKVSLPSLPLPSEASSTSPSLTQQAAITNSLPLPTRNLHVLPHQGKDSLEAQDTRRDSSGSDASYHLSFRLSTASSGLGESMTESLAAIAEEERSNGIEQVNDKKSQCMEAEIIKKKIYEVENRSRTKTYSYPNSGANKDVGSTHKQKAQTMGLHISFNHDSQTV